MGEPGQSNIWSTRKGGDTGRTEPSKYPEEEEPIRYSPSSGERNGKSLKPAGVIACTRYPPVVVGNVRSGVQTARLQSVL